MQANRINKYLVAAFALITLLFTIIANSQLVYAEEPDIATETDTPTIYCYAAIDGKWETVQVLQEASGRQMFGNKNRYYMTAEDLEEVYGDFGFKASKFREDSRIFAHTDVYDTSIIWTDAAPVGSGKDAKIPISFRNITYLYYVPGNTPDSESYFATSKKVTDETLLKENTFYFIEFNDTSNAYRADLPSTTYVMGNESYKVKLSSIKGFKWKVVNAHTKEEITNATVDDNGLYATINIPEVKESISIELLPEGQYILYDARLDDKLEKVGEFRAAQQEVSENGTVNGNGFFADVDYNNADVYTLLSPDKDYSISKLAGSISNGRKFYYTFKGWKVGDTDTILQPNDTLTKNELENYFAGEKELRLTAVWSPFSEDELHRINSLNFFVNINCEIMDTMSNGFQLQHPEEFTESVSATRVDNAENVPKSLGTEFMILAPPTEEDTAYEVDSALRNADTNPIEYGLAAENFPSDETVLSHLRKIQDTTNRPVLFNGQKVSAKDLTTENFAIRWYVLKYNSSDGWHIDGILVAKQGYLVVKKTFVGDEEVINTIKNNGFTLNVTHDEDGSTITDYILSISTQDQNGIVKGYSEYDEKTNTYTWILPLRQQRDYTVKELQYLPNEEQQKEWRCESSYITYNTDDKTDNWQQYDPDTGICVTAIAYPMDMPESSYQTIELQNSYVKAGMLTIAKLDSFTNRGMQNIAFKISREDGKEVGLFKKPSSNEYSNENFAILNGYTEKIENNIINTDVNGNIYIKLAVENEGLSGEYILEEITPDGYINPAKIHIKVTDDGTIKFIHTVLSEGTANVSGLDTEKLTIKNESRLLTSVIAQAKWHDTEKQDMQPVVIELWCNGVKVSGEKYTQTLNSKNDWSYEWSNLPLFVDGVLAQYSLKEAYIGDVSYDPKADTDGYVQYSILRDATLYKEGKDGTYQTDATWNDETDTTHYADNALLVTNIYPTNTNSKKANIEFTKTDSSGKFIPGAVFALYSDEACTNELATATSGDNGYVKFGEYDNGTYYLKEIYAPENYSLENSIYKVSVKNGKMTLLNADNTQVRTVVNETIPTTYINVQKVWNDNNNNDGIRPDSVIVTITGLNGFSKSATINAANNWNCVFDKLPTKTQTGEGIEYSLHENDVDGYTASITKTNDTNYTITNTHIPESTIYIVSKQWNDEDNQDGIRPDSITVQLSDQYGNTYDGELSENTDWKYVFEDLPRYKNGEELHYALAENDVDGYSSEIAATGNIATLTNTHIPETIHYTIRKIWNDNDNSDGLRPDTITVHIQSEQGYDDTVTLTKKNDWQDIEVTLPYFINGQEAHYTFSEDEVAEYETAIDESENVVTITNSHLPKTTSIHIEKVWNDDNNNDNVRPESISVILTGSDGNSYTADITAESNWEYDFEELPLYTEDGKLIEYSLEEQPVENYTTNIEKAENSFTITNTHESETIDLTIQKVWDDEEDKYELRPMSIFIKVTGTDGYENTLKLSKQSDFKCTLQNLPKYSDGKLIEYSVFENEVIGYASSISEEDNVITITNKLMVRPIETAIPMPSQSPEPSESPKPSESPSPVPSPTKEPDTTPSPAPTESPIPSATPKPSQSPEPSSSPTPTPTITPEPSKEPVVSPTPSPTITPEPTKEPEVTPAPTESPEPSETPIPTNTPEITPEPSSSPKPTETPIPTEAPDETPTPKPTESPTPTETPNPKPSIEIPVNTPTPTENAEENTEIPADTSIRINVIQVTNKQTGISFWKYLLSIFFRLS